MLYCIISSGRSSKSKYPCACPPYISCVLVHLIDAGRYRVDGDKMGWNSSNAAARQQYRDLNKAALQKFFERQFLIIGAAWTFFWVFRNYIAGWFDAAHAARTIATTPDWWETTWHLMVGLLLFETNFYWLHVAQHKWWYASHKIHHMYKSPNVLTASWGSIPDGIASELIPHIVIPLLLGFHMYTTWMVNQSINQSSSI